MAINPIYTLTIIENIFCIYRNYCVVTKIQRLIFGLRLMFEIALIAIPLLKLNFNVSMELSKTELIYFAVSVVSAFAVIILAMYHAKDFQNLKIRINKSHLYFTKDSAYSRNVNKKIKFTGFVFVLYAILMGGLVAIVSILTKSNNIFGHLYNIIIFFHNLRYIFEFVVLYSVLLLLSEQVKCITRKIATDRKLRIDDDDESDNNEGEIIQEITGFDEWTRVYTNIKECSNLVNTVFGVQITITLTSMIFLFIIFLYVIVSMSISGNVVWITILVYTIKVIVLLISLYALSRGAQTAENSVNDLRRCLGKLLIYSPIEDGSYKVIKDFLRLVTNRPIKTQAFGSINVDMTLVPKFVMFFTSYTVIALQFNNVV